MDELGWWWFNQEFTEMHSKCFISGLYKDASFTGVGKMILEELEFRIKCEIVPHSENIHFGEPNATKILKSFCVLQFHTLECRMSNICHFKISNTFNVKVITDVKIELKVKCYENVPL